MDLKDILKGKVVIVGIGNILKGDDGFGPALIERLRDRIPAVLIDAGTAPESYLGRIVRENADTVLFVDAVHLDQPPAAYDVLARDEILKSGMTTHDISPRMMIDYLAAQTGADIYLLGVQPRNMDLGEEMSCEVRQTLDEIEQRMVSCMKPI